MSGENNEHDTDRKEVDETAGDPETSSSEESPKKQEELPTQREEIQKVLGLGKEEAHKLTPEQQQRLLFKIKIRLTQESDHYKRPEGISFTEVEAALKTDPKLMFSLAKMEETGGKPDIIAAEDDLFIFADCSAESPSGRRNLEYDQATEMAKKFGVEMMSKNVYKKMQETGEFDQNTWSWLASPADIREASYALFGSHGDVSMVHVSQSDACNDFGSGGWRGVLKVPKAA